MKPNINLFFDPYFLFYILPKYKPTKEDIRELGFVQDAVQKGIESKTKYNPHRWLLMFIQSRVIQKRKKLLIQESPY